MSPRLKDDRSLFDDVFTEVQRHAKGSTLMSQLREATEAILARVELARPSPSPETEAPTMYEGRIQDVASENFGPFPRQTDEEAMTAIERGIFEQRLTIERLTHPPAAPAAEPGRPATCRTKCGGTGDDRRELSSEFDYPRGACNGTGRATPAAGIAPTSPICGVIHPTDVSPCTMPPGHIRKRGARP